MSKIFLFLLLLFFQNLFGGEVQFSKSEKKWIEENKKVSVVMLGDYLPFSFIKDGKHQGLSLDILKEIEKVSGLQFEITTGNWNTILEDFKNQKSMMIADISYVPEREEFTLFSSPYYEIPAFVFGKIDDEHYKNNQSLKGKRVAITKNIYYKEELEKLGIIIVECETSLDKVSAVVSKKADYFLDPFLIGKRSLELAGTQTIRALDEFGAVKKEDLRFGISKADPLLQGIIEKSYRSISTSTLINISNRWMISSSNEQHEQNSIDFTDEELAYIKSKKIITYSEVNWKPLSIIENGKMNGIMGDYLDLVAKKTGLVFEYVPSKSWSEVLERFEKKEIDLVPGVGSSDQEARLGIMSDMYASYPMVIVAGSKYQFIDSLKMMRGKIVAVPKYYTSYNFLKQNYPDIKILATKDIGEALLKVHNGEAEAFVGHIATSLYYLSQLYLKDLKVVGTADFVFEHHYLIQNEDKILASIINKAFKAISQQERQNIYNTWVQTTVVEEAISYQFLWKILGVVALIFVVMLYFQRRLKSEVGKKTKELSELNASLEDRIKKEVEKHIMIEQKLFESDKLASLGEMIGNIAHQWRQPLSVISTAATGLQLQREMGVLNETNVDRLCTAINENAQYLSRTIEDFRDFIKGDRAIERFNIGDTFQSLKNLIESSLQTHNITLKISVKEAIFIEGHPNELLQCLMNLFNNAKDALKEHRPSGRYIEIGARIKNEMCQINFKDNGGGIPEGIMGKIFEPYFTTKHKSTGTGLGLHMTYNLITKGMQGAITVTNTHYELNGKPYDGALFQIEIPLKIINNQINEIKESGRIPLKGEEL